MLTLHTEGQKLKVIKDTLWCAVSALIASLMFLHGTAIRNTLSMLLNKVSDKISFKSINVFAIVQGFPLVSWNRSGLKMENRCGRFYET